MLISFGRWAPGLADTTPGRSSVLDGVAPRADDSYGPMSQFVTGSDSVALASNPRGQIAFPTTDGSYVRFVGTSSKIQQVQADGTLTDIDTGLSLPSGDVWSFAVFGTKLLYTNTSDGMIAYDFVSGGAASAVSGAPKARFIFVAGDRVVALDCDGDNRLMQTSAINDHTEWQAGGASYQPFADGGELTGGVAVTQGAAIIFQREAIRLMQFGAVSGMQFGLQRLTNESGALNGPTIVSANGWAYYIATNGPLRIAPGMARPQSIGSVDGVDRWILDQVDAADLDKIEGTFDPFRRMIWWRIKVSGDSDEVYSKVVGFHIDYERWVTLSVSTSAMFSTALPGYTYDTVPDDTYDEVADLPYDDRYWGGGEPLFGGFDGAYKFATFSGTPMAVTATSSRHLFPASQDINSVTPDTDAENATIAVGTADTPQGPLTWSGDVSLNNEGDAMFLERGRAIAGRLSIPAGESWTYLRGFRDINESAR